MPLILDTGGGHVDALLRFGQGFIYITLRVHYRIEKNRKNNSSQIVLCSFSCYMNTLVIDRFYFIYGWK